MHVLNMTVTAFGLLYESRRPDRESYIDPVGSSFEEAAYSPGDIDSVVETPYDISSFLHKNKVIIAMVEIIISCSGVLEHLLANL
jgi:hypothetical protein